MIYDLPTFDPPALLAGEQVEPIKRKRRGTNARRSRSIAPALVIGMVFLMDDGTLCRVVQVEPEPLCLPLPPEENR